MKIERAPNGYTRPDNFLTLKETFDLVGNLSQAERQSNITRFVHLCFDWPSMAIMQFITKTMNEYMSCLSPCGRPAYTQKEAAWQSYLDLLNAAAWEEENREFIIEF